jgi:hypothetical protein
MDDNGIDSEALLEGVPEMDRRRLALLGAALFGGGALASAGEAVAAGAHKLTISLDGKPRDFGIPDTIDGARVKRDCEILAKLITDKPKAIPAIYHAALNGDAAGATKEINAIGLTEEAFVAQGGGLWHLLILLAIAAYLASRRGH